jgi:Zn-dependent M28 family amino/carboxypeptidase
VSGTALGRGAPPVPGPLGSELALEIDLSSRAFDAANVACLLPGNDPTASDTVIAFTAHYDHLGVGVPDSSGDAIYNGFSDNAAGVAMLLAIAQAMTQDSTNHLRHSVLFLFLAGEERGLLGSDYYVSNPLWPLERTEATINIDAGAPPGLLVSWRLAGVDSSGLGRLAIAVAANRGWTVSTSPPRANSDYYPFVREGVPAVFVIPGPEPYEGLTADSTAALRRRWDHYHRPGDHWTDDFPFAGMARYAEYAYSIAAAVDTSSIPMPRPTKR